MKKVILLSFISLSGIYATKRAPDDPRFQPIVIDQIGIEQTQRKYLEPPVPFTHHLEEFPARRTSRLTITLQEPLTSEHAQPMSAYLSELDQNFLAGTLLRKEEREEAKRYVKPYSRIREQKGPQPHRGVYIHELVIQNSDGSKKMIFKKSPDKRMISYLFIYPDQEELYHSLYFLKDKLLKELLERNNF